MSMLLRFPRGPCHDASPLFSDSVECPGCSPLPPSRPDQQDSSAYYSMSPCNRGLLYLHNVAEFRDKMRNNNWRNPMILTEKDETWIKCYTYTSSRWTNCDRVIELLTCRQRDTQIHGENIQNHHEDTENEGILK